MTIVAPKHARRAALGAILLLGLGAGVHAAGREPAIELTAAPAGHAAAAGATVRYRVVLQREGGFARRVAIYARGFPRGSRVVWRLVNGAKLQRAYTRGPTVIVPARRGAVVLSVTIAPGTRPATFRPRVRAYGKGVRTGRRLRLEVRPGGVVSPAPAPSFALAALQGGRRVLQGEQASWEVELERRGGLTEPIAMAVEGLPPDARADWSAPGPVSGDRVTLTVSTARSTPPGSYELTVSASASGTTARAAATLDVVETRPFGIGGDATAPLRPGRSSPLDLRLDNPYDFPLRVERIEVTVAERTSVPGCSGTANYAVEQLAGVYPLVVPPGTTRLSELVPASALPRVAMRETGANQDVCRGAAITLAYQGAAGK